MRNVEMASAYSIAVSFGLGIWNRIILIEYGNGLIRIWNVFIRIGIVLMASTSSLSRAS